MLQWLLLLTTCSIQSCTASSWVSVPQTQTHHVPAALSLSALLVSQATATPPLDPQPATPLDPPLERPVGEAELEEMFLASLTQRFKGNANVLQRTFRRRIRRKFPKNKIGHMLKLTTKRLQQILMKPPLDLMLVHVPLSVRSQQHHLQQSIEHPEHPAATKEDDDALRSTCGACEELSRELKHAASQTPSVLITELKKLKAKKHHTAQHQLDNSLLQLIQDTLAHEYDASTVPFSYDTCNQTYCDLAMLYRGSWYVLPYHSEEMSAKIISSDLSALLLTVVHQLIDAKEVKQFIMHAPTTVLIIHHDDSDDDQDGHSPQETQHDATMKQLADTLGGDIPVGWCHSTDLPSLLSVYRRTHRSPKEIKYHYPTIVIFRNYVGHSVEENVYTFLNMNGEGGTDTKEQQEQQDQPDAKENGPVTSWQVTDDLIQFIYRARLGTLEQWTPSTDQWFKHAGTPSTLAILDHVV